MKSKLIKIIILTLLISIVSCNVTVFAEIRTPTKYPDFYKPDLQNTNSTSLKEKVGKILGVINAIGVVTSVVVLMTIGLKYMFGSVEEKAEYKKIMVGYVIGAILVFSVTTIPNILYNFGSKIGDPVNNENGGGRRRRW